MDRLSRLGRKFLNHRHVCVAALLLMGILHPLQAQVTSSMSQAQSGPGGTGTLVVAVKGSEGTTLPSLAIVNVYTPNQQLVETATFNGASVRFPDLLLGTYIVEASCVGYETAREQAELLLKNDQQQVLIVLRPAGKTAAGSVASGPPLLAPKVQKELNKALEEIRSQRYDEARKLLASAEKAAPNHPDVNYLLGLLDSLAGNAAEAQSYWEKALKFDPNHYFSLLALGEASFGKGNLDEAKELLNHAGDANPNAWRPHEVLAHIYLGEGSFEDAEKEAEHALKLGKGEPNGVRLVLAKALIARHEKSRAIVALQEFLKGNATDAQAASARKLLEALRQPEIEKEAELTVRSRPSADTLTLPPNALPSLSAKWMPPNIDDFIPPVTEGVGCDLPAVVTATEQRVLEFVKSLDSFTATESLQHQVFNAKGRAIRSEGRKYNYLVSIREVRPGILDVEEYRNATLTLDVFPDGLATLGLPSVILIFHPVNVGYYELNCEGLSSWHGKLAWQVRFQQKDPRTHPVREYRGGGILFPAGLKGRAWIAADSFQVVRMETDLLRPIPEIRLLADHQAIDYGPVRFQHQDLTLWLPSITDLYLDFHGRRVHRRHSYDDYLLFSVEDKQKIDKPKEQVQVQNEM